MQLWDSDLIPMAYRPWGSQAPLNAAVGQWPHLWHFMDISCWVTVSSHPNLTHREHTVCQSGNKKSVDIKMTKEHKHPFLSCSSPRCGDAQIKLIQLPLWRINTNTSFQGLKPNQLLNALHSKIGKAHCACRGDHRRCIIGAH